MTTAARHLDVSDPATFDRWCTAPAHDTRTIEEFAADGGRPVYSLDIRIEDLRLTRAELPPEFPEDEDQ